MRVEGGGFGEVTKVSVPFSTELKVCGDIFQSWLSEDFKSYL